MEHAALQDVRRPINTIGLVIAPNMHAGYTFEVHDVREHTKIVFKAPMSCMIC